jgi:cell shape-determining protein MreC
MVQWNRVRGLVQGTGNDLFAVANMHYIDLKEEIREGDVVVTSPDSVFPSGYPVGRIIRGPTLGQLAQSADIAPAVDPFRLDEVFVILNAAPDAEALAGPVPPAAEPALTASMNYRTVQERYAP